MHAREGVALELVLDSTVRPRSRAHLRELDCSLEQVLVCHYLIEETSGLRR